MRARLLLLMLGLFLVGSPPARAATSCKADEECGDQYCDPGLRTCQTKVACQDDTPCKASGRLCNNDPGKVGFCIPTLCFGDGDCLSFQVCRYEDVKLPQNGGYCTDRANFIQYEGGCSAAGGGPGALAAAARGATSAASALSLLGLLILAARRRRQRAVRSRGPLAVALLGAATALAPAAAQAEGALNAQTFRPAIGPENLITLEGSRAARVLRPFGGLYLDFGHHPLRLTNRDTGETVYPTERLLTGHAVLGMGFTRWFSAGVALPVVLNQTSSSTADLRSADSAILGAPNSVGLGDLRLALKFSILDNHQGGFGLAFAPQGSFPTGDGTRFRGDDAYGIEPRVVADYKFHQGSFIAVNASFNYRTSAQEALNVRVDSQVRYGLGGLFQLPAGLAVVGEVGGAFSISKLSPDYGAFYAPLEGALALRWHHKTGVQVDLGGGGPFLSAPGVPLFRVFAGVGFYLGRRDVRELPTTEDEPRRPVPVTPPIDPDRDGDGVVDRLDKCPLQGGTTENEGCPDSDQDNDGVIDRLDKCVDKAGASENGGCPDTDQDSDGVVDRLDKCIDKAGVKELDGCPEPDQDSDGIIDKLDKCADKAGPKENQGCPDTDKDSDGVVDRLDKCADKAGPKDNDGCPLLTLGDSAITMSSAVRFAAGTATLDAGSYRMIEALGRALGADESLKKAQFLVPGGPGKGGAKLATARVKTLSAALIKAGAPKKVLLIKADKKTVGDEIKSVQLTKAPPKKAKGAKKGKKGA